MTMAEIIDGKAVAAQVRAEVAADVAELKRRGVTPGLAVVLVGEDPASQVYVRGKTKAAAEAGIATFDHQLPAAPSQTQNLADVVRRADIVVAAIGKAELVRGDWIKEGATVIDVGMNRGSDGKLVGDVELKAAAMRARAITPVPGGVGPMTIAMLLA